MSFYLPPWQESKEPTESNVRQWLDNLSGKFRPIEQARWNQSHIDTLFYAGSQSYINSYYNFSQGHNAQKFHFNLIQQPVNMVTGYQRQHRRSIQYIPTEGADTETTDQYTSLITTISNKEGLQEHYSRGTELSAISGMVLLQPYLDFTRDDPSQGNLRLKVWEYNSFMVDPFFREPDMSDANFVWCQEYISKQVAEARFPGMVDKIKPMYGAKSRSGNFYFLPEQRDMGRNDLLTLSYVWYKWHRKKKMLYSRSRHQFFEFAEDNPMLDMTLYQIPDLQLVTQDVTTWKCAVVLNDKLIHQGFNPLGLDCCPFVPVFWNYDPQMSEPDLRTRSLVRTMRDAQFLYNRRIILNHDISESSINSGWMRKSGAVANEDQLKKTGQGWDLVINEGYELSDVQKIIPNAVPPSDMQLGDQLASLIFSTSGVDIENWSAQQDHQASTLTVLLKQGANLMVLQKYFDQWDYALKILGDKMLRIVLNNWNAAKVGLIIGEEPSPFFYSKIFAKYQVIVEEGLDTAVQKQQQFQQVLELNQALGGVIPPSYIASIATIQGKKELMEALQQQEMLQQALQQEQRQLEQATLEAQMQELYSKAAANVAMARERHGRAESNIGLFEERLSEISQNRSMATKNKVESLSKLLETLEKYGPADTALSENQVDLYSAEAEAEEDRESVDAKRTALANNFYSEVMSPSQEMAGEQADQMQQQQPELQSQLQQLLQQQLNPEINGG